jgi:triacylglycerol lipase
VRSARRRGRLPKALGGIVGVGLAGILLGSSTLAPRTATVPVLLIPGWFDTGRDLTALRIRMLGAGWPSDRVETITFDDPTGSNRDHAVEIAVDVRGLIERTGATEIDVVVHSIGGLALRWYLLTTPDGGVRRIAFIGSPHRGTHSAHLAGGAGRAEMMPGSAFLDTLNAERPAPTSVEAITIRTVTDTHVVPGISATLPGVPDHELCCPTHAGLLRDDDVFDLVRSFLDHGAGQR